MWHRRRRPFLNQVQRWPHWLLLLILLCCACWIALLLDLMLLLRMHLVHKAGRCRPPVDFHRPLSPLPTPVDRSLVRFLSHTPHLSCYNWSYHTRWRGYGARPTCAYMSLFKSSFSQHDIHPFLRAWYTPQQRARGRHSRGPDEVRVVREGSIAAMTVLLTQRSLSFSAAHVCCRVSTKDEERQATQSPTLPASTADIAPITSDHDLAKREIGVVWHVRCTQEHRPQQ